MTDHRGQLNRVQRKEVTHLLRHVGLRILEYIQPIVVFGGLFVVLLLQIPWMKDFLTGIGVRDAAGVTDTVVAVALCALFLEVRNLSQRMGSIPEQRHFADPLDVYPVLFERIQSIRRPDEKVLDVLGMDLYTAWPSIGFWLNRPELRDWSIRMTAVAHAESGTMQFFPHEWIDEGRRNLTKINDMRNARTLTHQGITLEAFGYDFVPVIHGFRLGNGDLFYSLLNWGEDGRINRDIYSYEYLPSDDRSASAEWLRGIFDSWFQRACRDRWPEQ